MYLLSPLMENNPNQWVRKQDFSNKLQATELLNSKNVQAFHRYF